LRISTVVSIVVSILALLVVIYIFDTISNEVGDLKVYNNNSNITSKTVKDLLGDGFFDAYKFFPIFMIFIIIGTVIYIVIGFSGDRYDEETTLSTPNDERDVIQTSDLPGHFVSHKEDFVAVYTGERKEAIHQSKRLRRKNYWTKVINTDNTSTDGIWLVYRSQWKRTEENDRGVPRWTRRRNN
jgi:hypothetical protein